MAQTTQRVVLEIQARGNAVRAIQQVDRQAGQLNNTIRSLQRSFIGIGAALGGLYALRLAFNEVVRPAIEFDTALRQIWTITQTTWGEMEKLGKTLRSLSVQFGKSAAEIAWGYYEIKSSGFEGADALKVLEASLKGAAASMEDVATVADVTTSILNAWRMSADKATWVNDVLFRTVDLGKVKIGDLAQNFGRLAGIAAPLGADFIELSAAISTLTIQGIQANEAVTAIRQAIVQLAKPTKTTQEVIRALGYESGVAMIQQLGFARAVAEVTKYAEEHNIALTDMFSNVRAILAVLPLATTAADTYAKHQRLLAEATGKTEEAFEKMADGLQHRINQLRAALGDLEIAITQYLIDPLTALTHLLATTIGTMARFTDVLKGLPQLLNPIAWLLGVGVAKAMGRFGILSGLSFLQKAALVPLTFTLAVQWDYYFTEPPKTIWGEIMSALQRAIAGAIAGGMVGGPIGALAGAAINVALPMIIRFFVQVDAQTTEPVDRLTQQVQNLMTYLRTAVEQDLKIKVSLDDEAVQAALQRLRESPLAQWEAEQLGEQVQQVVQTMEEAWLRGIPRELPEPIEQWTRQFWERMLKYVEKAAKDGWEAAADEIADILKVTLEIGTEEGAMKLYAILKDAPVEFAQRVLEGLGWAASDFISKLLQGAGEFTEAMQEGLLSLPGLAYPGGGGPTIAGPAGLPPYWEFMPEVQKQTDLLAAAWQDLLDALDTDELRQAVSDFFKTLVDYSDSASALVATLREYAQQIMDQPEALALLYGELEDFRDQIEESARAMEVFFGTDVAEAYRQQWEAVLQLFEDAQSRREQWSEQWDEWLKNLYAGNLSLQDLVSTVMGLIRANKDDIELVLFHRDQLEDLYQQYLAYIDALEAMGYSTEEARAAADLLAEALYGAAAAAETLTDQLKATAISQAAQLLPRVQDILNTLRSGMKTVVEEIKGPGGEPQYIEKQVEMTVGEWIELMAEVTSFRSVVSQVREEMWRLKGVPDAVRQGLEQLYKYLQEAFSGKTPEEIEEERRRMMERMMRDAARSLRRAAREAERQARELARRLQETFRRSFEAPIEMALATGEWEKAAAAIALMAQQRSAIAEFASLLPTLNGEIISMRDVYQMILSASRNLLSALDDEIRMRRLAGESAEGLAKLKEKLEELLEPPDPLTAWMQSIRQMVYQDPGRAGRELREMIAKAFSGETTQITRDISDQLKLIQEIIEAEWGTTLKESAEGVTRGYIEQAKQWQHQVQALQAWAEQAEAEAEAIEQTLSAQQELSASFTELAIDSQSVCSSLGYCTKQSNDLARAMWITGRQVTNASVASAAYANALKVAIKAAKESGLAQQKVTETLELSRDAAFQFVDLEQEIISLLEREIEEREKLGLETGRLRWVLLKFRADLENTTPEILQLKEDLPQLAESALSAASALNSLINRLEGGSEVLNIFLSGLIRAGRDLLQGDWLSALIGGISMLFDILITSLQEHKRKLEDTLRFYEETLREVANRLAGIADNIASAFLGPLGDFVSTLFNVWVQSIQMVFLEGLDLLRAGIDMLIGFVGGLIDAFMGLLRQSEAWAAWQEESRGLWKAIADLFGQFLWPLVGAIKYLRQFLGIQEEVNKSLASLNIPTGYKLARAAWGVVTPGEPALARGQYRIPPWADALGRKIAEAIMGLLQDLGISSWGDLLNRFAQAAEGMWEWIISRLPALVNAIKESITRVGEILDKHGISLDSIADWLARGVDWLIANLPDIVGNITEGIIQLFSVLQFAWDWIQKNLPTWDEIKKKWDEFIEQLKKLPSYRDLKSEIDRLTGVLKILQIALVMTLAAVAGAIVGALAAFAGVLTLGLGTPVVLFGAITGASLTSALALLILNSIPGLQGGGLVMREGLAYLHAGEAVIPAARVSQGPSATGSTYVIHNLNVTLPDVQDPDEFLEKLEHAIRRKNLRGRGVRYGTYAVAGR